MAMHCSPHQLEVMRHHNCLASCTSKRIACLQCNWPISSLCIASSPFPQAQASQLPHYPISMLPAVHAIFSSLCALTVPAPFSTGSLQTNCTYRPPADAACPCIAIIIRLALDICTLLKQQLTITSLTSS